MHTSGRLCPAADVHPARLGLAGGCGRVWGTTEMPSGGQMEQHETSLERRDALRRGAAVLAGVAGLGVAAAAMAPTADAAAGGPLVMGASNDAEATTTGLTSTSGDGTLALSNTGTGAPLRVAASPSLPADTSTAGDHRSFDTGAGFVLPTFTHVTGTGPAAPAAWGFVFSDIWAFQPIPVRPQRALDTRSVAGRARVRDPAGKFDSTGRLIGGRAITLGLSDYVFGPGAVFGNLTITGPLAAGFAVVYPADPRPSVSSINFVTRQTIANFTFTGLTFTGTDDTVRIYSSATTHVIFDVTAFAVGSADFLNPAILSAAAAPAGAIDLAAAPQWFRTQHARRDRFR